MAVFSDGTGSAGPDAGASGIYIPGFLALISQSEDELAFIIGHEMSHLVLRHYRVAPEYRKHQIPGAAWVDQQGEGSGSEKEADGLGTILVANAGYDPRAAGEALCSLERFSRSHSAYTPCFILNRIPRAGHGSTAQRMTRIDNILSQIGYSQSPPRAAQSQDLVNARAEIEKIKLDFELKRVSPDNTK